MWYHSELSQSSEIGSKTHVCSQPCKNSPQIGEDREEFLQPFPLPHQLHQLLLQQLEIMSWQAGGKGLSEESKDEVQKQETEDVALVE